MKSVRIIAATVLLSGAASIAASFPYVRDFLRYAPETTAVRDALSREFGELASPVRDIIAPPPLRSARSAPGAPLTPEGIVRETNKERIAKELPALRSNALLTRAAGSKVQDMFRGQYFDHVSPSGKGPGDLAKEAGYAYIVVGENLAEGGFSGDRDLVEAWMASPGHRANILHERFQEIGVAVGKGSFEGHEAWLAVQEFGLAASACPAIDEALVADIERKRAEFEELKRRAADRSSEIDRLRGTQESLYEEAQALVREGNQLIEEGNEKIQEGNRVYRETGSREAAASYWEEGARLQREGRDKIDEALKLNEKLKALADSIGDAVNSYNALVARLNALAEDIRALVDGYNGEVRVFNACAAGLRPAEVGDNTAKAGG